MDITIISSESDFTIVNGVVKTGTYIFQSEVTIAHDLTFGTSCTLVFNGGKIVGRDSTTGNPVNIILTGNTTVITAPMSCIFDDYVGFAGSWKISEAYPEWFEPNTDSAIPINKALQLLKDSGGPLRMTGTYRINSPIVVPPHIILAGNNPGGVDIVLEPKNGVNESNYDIFDVDDDRWTSSREIKREVSSGVYSTLRKYVRAAIYFQGRTQTKDLNVGCGAHNLNVFMNGCACHAFYIERPYDQTVWSNLKVERVHHSFNAFRLTVPYEYQDIDTNSFDRFETVDGGAVPQATIDAWNAAERARCGQTVLMFNCWGLKNPYQAGNNFLTSPIPPTGKVIAPVYYFYNQQEMNLTGCKAAANQMDSYRIGTRVRTVTEYGGICMHLEGCRGVVMSGCSVGACNVGIAITSNHHTTDGVTIIGLTSECVVHLDVMAQGVKTESTNSAGNTVMDTLRPVRRLVVTPIRHEDSQGNIYLEECYMSDVNVTDNLQSIYIMPRSYMLNVTSVSSVFSVPATMNFNPAIQVISGTKGQLPMGCSNVIYSNANTKKGLRFLERVTVAGKDDSNGTLPIVTDNLSIAVIEQMGVVSLHGETKMRIMDNGTTLLNTPAFDILNGTTTSNALARFAAPLVNNSTGMQLLVKDADGNMTVLPVKISEADAYGHRMLYV